MTSSEKGWVLYRTGLEGPVWNTGDIIMIIATWEQSMGCPENSSLQCTMTECMSKR